MTYDQSGNYTAIIAFVVGLINNFAPFLGVTTQGVVAIISAITVVYGVYKQWVAHRNLAISAGVKGIK
jgi:hypothetical protein